MFNDNTIPCCSGNIGDVFLGYLSIFIEKQVNVAHQNLPNAYNERTATSRTTERLPRVCNWTVYRGWWWSVRWPSRLVQYTSGLVRWQTSDSPVISSFMRRWSRLSLSILNLLTCDKPCSAETFDWRDSAKFRLHQARVLL